LDVRGGINAGTNGTEFTVSTSGALTAATINTGYGAMEVNSIAQYEGNQNLTTSSYVTFGNIYDNGLGSNGPVYASSGLLYVSSGWCPKIYSLSESDYQKEGGILQGISGKYYETEQKIILKRLKNNEDDVIVKIAAEDPEVDYIDSVRLLIKDKNSNGEERITELKPTSASENLDVIKEKDENYFVGYNGSELIVKFENIPSLSDDYTREIELFVKVIMTLIISQCKEMNGRSIRKHKKKALLILILMVFFPNIDHF